MILVIMDLLLLFLLNLPYFSNGVPLSSFYPYGQDVNDSLVGPTDDGNSDIIYLTNSFLFFGNEYTTLYVSHSKAIASKY